MQRLIELFEICYEYELAFAKTTTPHAMLEMMLLKMAQGTVDTHNGAQTTTAPRVSQTPTNKQPLSQNKAAKVRTTHKSTENAPTQSMPVDNEIEPALHYERVTESPESTQAVSPADSVAQQEMQDPQWVACLQEIEHLNDPLVVSIFKQGSMSKHEEGTNSLEIIFSKDLLFFKEWLENTKKVWQPIIVKHYGDKALHPQFTGASQERPLRSAMKAPIMSPTPAKPAEKVTQWASSGAFKAYNGKSPTKSSVQSVEKERVVTITDPEKWQKAHSLLQFFPGTLTVSSAEGEGA